MTDQNPQAELDGYRAQRMAGTLSQRDYLAHAERLGPLIADAPTKAPAAQSDAQVKLDQLRSDRMAGRISQPAYLKEMERLAPLVSGEKPSASDPPLQVSPALQQEIDLLMAPPESPNDYRFEYLENPPQTPEAQQLDADVRSAFHTMGVPKARGGLLYGAIEAHLKRAQDWTEEHVAHNTEVVESQLRVRWGKDYEARIAAVGALLQEATREHPSLDALMNEAPWIVDSVGVFTELDAIAQHRARK